MENFVLMCCLNRNLKLKEQIIKIWRWDIPGSKSKSSEVWVPLPWTWIWGAQGKGNDVCRRALQDTGLSLLFWMREAIGVWTGETTISGLHCQRIILTDALWILSRVSQMEPRRLSEAIAIIQARNDGDLEQGNEGRGTERWLHSGCIEIMQGDISRAINNPHLLEIVK